MISKTRKYHSQSLKYGLADKISYVMRNNLFLYSKYKSRIQDYQ